MKHAGTNRGSALMLVVGLLTIVAMLGSTFLIASYLEAQQVLVITTRGPVPPLTNGVFSEVQQVLKFDEYLAEDLGKFGQLSRIPKDWKNFVDMPGKVIDPHLTDISTEEDPWLSKVFGDVDDYGKVDTDGDDEADAWLYNVRVMNSRGDIYYMALRVIDLSGLICINTAGDREATFTSLPSDPAMVDLKGHLGEDTYNELHAARRGTGSSTLEDYTKNCGRRMLSPVSGYTPFPFADEVVLRWLKSGSDSEGSKLYEILQGQGQSREQLTTIGSSQSILRYPKPDEKERARILLDKPDALAPIGEVDNSVRLSNLMTDAMGSPDEAAAAGEIMDNPVPPVDWVYRTDDSNVIGKNYLQYPANVNTTPGSRGVFTPPFWRGVDYDFVPDEDGDYVVSCRAPSSDDSAPAVTVGFLLRGATFGSVGVWDQTQLGNQWIEVGLVEGVVAGDSVTIKILAAGTEGFAVNADAVMLTRKTGIGCPEAVHFVANAWAYSGDRDVPDSQQAYAVSPDAVWMAYGVVPQMVISEVFLHYAVTTEGEQWLRAIELLNPTDESITGNYRITCGDGVVEFPVVNAASGERIVLLITGATGTASPPELSTFGLDASSGILCAALDWFPANDIRIERLSNIPAIDGTPGMDVWIPVDSIVPLEVLPEGWAGGTGTYLAERDDDLARQRCLIPVYVKSSVAPDGHSLGEPNELAPGLGALDEAEVLEGFYIRRIPAGRTRPDSVGDFTACYLVGPDSDGNDLPHKLYPIDEETGKLNPDKRSYHNKLSRGRANIGFTNPDAMAYPDVPWGTLLAEFVETVDPDPEDGNEPNTRIFGRININTALLDVLARLPYPATITVEWQEVGGVARSETVDVDPYLAAQEIINYRDTFERGAYSYLVDPSYNAEGKDDGAPTDLRDDGLLPPIYAADDADPETISNTKMKGFFTPGEVAIPLAAYGETLIAQAMYGEGGTLSDDDRKQTGYLDARDALYCAVISSVTVNSDTFAATAVVNVGNPPRYSTNYVAIIDCKNCEEPDDSPSVVFLTEIK